MKAVKKLHRMMFGFNSQDDGSITPLPVLERPNLADMLAKVTPDNLPDETDVSWGKPQGNEAW